MSDDIKAAHEMLKSMGVVFTQEPTQAPWDRLQTFATFSDSEGNTVMISSD